MADPFGMGLPNQALKSLTSQYSSNPLQTIPIEATATVALGGAGETDVIVLQTVPSNRKVTLDSLTVTAANVDCIFKLYRSGVAILTFIPAISAQSVQVFSEGVGKEYDEAETWKVTVTSATGAGNVSASASGRSELKRQMLYSPLIA